MLWNNPSVTASPCHLPFHKGGLHRSFFRLYDVIFAVILAVCVCGRSQNAPTGQRRKFRLYNGSFNKFAFRMQSFRFYSFLMIPKAATSQNKNPPISRRIFLEYQIILQQRGELCRCFLLPMCEQQSRLLL